MGSVWSSSGRQHTSSFFCSDAFELWLHKTPTDALAAMEEIYEARVKGIVELC